MNLKSFVNRAFSAVAALVLSAQAIAQSPVGQWEATVSGKVDGYSQAGTCYIQFNDDNTIEGFYIPRKAAEVYQVSGSWTQVGTRFTGEVDVDIGDDFPTSFSMTGSARAGRSLSAKLNSLDGRVSLSGKPLLESMTDFSGEYVGTFSQSGVTGVLQLVLTASAEFAGLYEISGFSSSDFADFELTGFAVINRRGAFVGYIEDVDFEFLGSIWGSIRRGRPISGQGWDLFNESPFRFRIEDSSGSE
jgi:hypothetical protein